jgi:hypothetical protein
MNATANTDLIAAFANLARQPHVLPSPARSAELDAIVRPLRREAQVRLNVVGLPRGLAMVA